MSGSWTGSGTITTSSGNKERIRCRARYDVDGGGSTLDDTQYVDIEGVGGSFQDRHKVYDRAGQPCLTSGKAEIQRVATAGRSTHFCPRCQR